MDPASVIGIIGVVAQITEAIYNYGDAIREYKTEVAQLRSELFGMQAALTQIEQDLTLGQANGTASTNLSSPQCQIMLNETRLVLQDLAATLKDGLSKGQILKKRLVWPLKRPKVQALATHLERLKTFFILAATRESLQAAEDLQSSVNTLQESVDEIQQTQQEEAIYLEAMKCLAPCDSRSAHAGAASSRLVGTNSWFLDEPFREWLSGTSALLWVKGKPGSGKTCLISACADRLLQADHLVSYFYCSSNDSSSQEPQNILGSLLAQLCRQRSEARSLVLAAYQQSKSRNAVHDLLQASTLASLLREVTAKLTTYAFIFVDAADECGDRLVPVLEALFQVVSRPGRIRMMLSSTKSAAPTIRDCSSKYSLPPKEINLDIVRVGRDINTYIESRFAQESKLRRLRPDLQLSLIKKIQDQHEGSFRWTSCTIDELLRRTTPKAIKSALDGVASTLGDIYTAILRNIPSDTMKVATSMLQYLVSAMRPLTLEELGEVASLVLAEEFDEDDRLIEPEAIVNRLHSLVHYDPATQRIELAHSSVRIFLTDPTLSGPFYVDPVAANISMAQACVYYLTLPAFRQLCPNDAALSARKRDWPFFEYASGFWTRHARRMTQRCDEYQHLFVKFATSTDGLGGGGGQFASWYQCVYPQGDPGIWATAPLYMCAREGLVEPIKALLERYGTSTEHLEQQGGARASTALHVAATYGEIGAVQLLLAAGADPNECNIAGESGIQWAAHFGYDEIVQLLLDAGADPALLAYKSNPELYKGMMSRFDVVAGRHVGTEKEEMLDGSWTSLPAWSS
ncbi:hypothetical protein PWT90_09593 [Aphanocladium album]|nr:hypothetical protein PWT90_09593 [Aphanocladium album]